MLAKEERRRKKQRKKEQNAGTPVKFFFCLFGEILLQFWCAYRGGGKPQSWPSLYTGYTVLPYPIGTRNVSVLGNFFCRI